MGALARDTNRQRKRGPVEPGRPMGHLARAMPDKTTGKRGRPAFNPTDVKLRTVSARVKPALRAALDKMAKDQRRKPTEMARIILGERLIAEGLLPEDFEF